MRHVMHPFFGELDNGRAGVMWQGHMQLHGQPVRVDVWAAGRDLDAAELDALALVPDSLDALDREARAQLARYLDSNPDFIHEHSTPDALAVYADWAAQLAKLDGQVSVPQFVNLLRLVGVGLYPARLDSPAIVMDYKIDPVHSDQILAVALDADGHFLHVAEDS